jgi:phage shock protein E
MGLFSSLFGGGSSNSDIKQLIADGAVIIDVRTPGEFSGGHPKGAVNIPLDQISNSISKIKNYKKPVVLCCASGNRSSSAKRVLLNHGVENVNDAGSWYSIA